MHGRMVVKSVMLVNTVILLHLHFFPGSFKRDVTKPKREMTEFSKGKYILFIIFINGL